MTMVPYYTPHAAGVFTLARFQERAAYSIETQFFSSMVLLRWTFTGRIGGGSLFDASICPAVKCTIEAASNRGHWTNAGEWGDMLVNECPTAAEQWMYETEYDGTNNHWITRLWLGGPASSSGSTGGSDGRKVVAKAWGLAN